MSKESASQKAVILTAKVPTRSDGAGLAAWAIVVGLVVTLGAKPAVSGSPPGKVYVADDMPGIEQVAIMPFKAPTDASRALFTSLTIRELIRLGRYRLLEPEAIANKLELPTLALAALTPQQACEVGALLEVEAVILGTVTRFEKKTAQERAVSAGAKVRMIHCPTGRTLWAVMLSERAAQPGQSLSDHADAVVRKMMLALDRKLPSRADRATSETLASQPERPSAKPLESPETRTASSSVPRRPPPPEGLEIADVDLREVSIAWGQPDPRHRRYRVERAPVSSGPYRTLAEVAPKRRFFRDFDRMRHPLADGQRYFYRLVAWDEEGRESSPTPAVEAKTPPPPSPPATIEATAQDARLVELTWSESDSDGVEQYRIERARADAPAHFEEIAVVRERRFRDGGGPHSALEDRTTYLYRVTPVNRVEAEGSPSEVVAVTTPPPPEPVRNLVAEDGEVRCVPLSWTLSPETNVVEYRVYRTTTENGAFEWLKTVPGRTNTRFIDGDNVPGNLPDDTRYYYMVKAVNAAGAESPPSAVVHANTRSKPPPVTGLEARSGEPRQVTLHWEVSPDRKVVGYEIWRAAGDSNHFVPVGKTSRRASVSFVDRGGTERREGLGLLLDGRLYRYKVLAYNTAHVPSEWSAAATARTRYAPGAPVNIRATTDRPNAIELSWPANPEPDVREYVVEISRRRGAFFKRQKIVPVSPEHARYALLDEGLSNGDERYYRVKVVDVAGLQSDWSEPVHGQSKPIPDPPSNVYASAVDGDRVKVRWDSPVQDDVEQYRIWVRKFLGWRLLDSTQATEYVLNPNRIGWRVVLSVSAVDRDGLESPRSEAVKAHQAASD